MKFNRHEAKSQLSRLARLAWPYRKRLERRQPGGLEGQIRIGADFDADDEEIVAAFENSTLFPDSE